MRYNVNCHSTRNLANKLPKSEVEAFSMSWRVFPHYEICKSSASSLLLRFMGHIRNLKSIPTPHPPGFRFRPTEEQLLCYYLSNKNNRESPTHHNLSVVDVPLLGSDVIEELDLYNYDPCDLPEIACFPFGDGGRKKHWYCFTAKATSDRGKRKTRGGFWKSRGRARDVIGKGVLLGKRKTFVFYRGNSLKAEKSGWMMYEYALVDHLKDSFVLCRIFLRSCNGNKISKHVQTCYAEENIAATHDAGTSVTFKQHDTASTSDICEFPLHEKTSIDINNGIHRCQMKAISKLDDLVVAQQISDGFQFPVFVPQCDEREQVPHSGG
ncbi:PREDICTED: NAC domain-containing protein 72-like isoform X2 [Nelumbo nucifera]|uniref:NAC domain-containing protein 72-like isoform X2 n=1 Tax=Nelumbo nucifera TaxID=4432 RepID=A0A1U8ALD1_NELNU|nr:PREDICTED: NAC domain-containing protein 72-like isoform X2 [Nelumbo nucifera]